MFMEQIIFTYIAGVLFLIYKTLKHFKINSIFILC